MTNEEIKNMPAGDEMRELLATVVMGWTPIEFESELSKGRIINGWFDRIRKTTHRSDMWCPDGNFEDAEMILSHLAKVPLSWTMDSVNLKDSTVWYVRLLGDTTEGVTRVSAIEETLPLAICRAALLFFSDRMSNGK